MTDSPGPGGRALVPWPRVWKWVLASSLVSVVALTLPESSKACPPRCECSAQLRSVSCQRRRLTNIPEGIPTETRVLDLSKNRLRWIQSGDLAPYPRLEEVDLSENLIATLEPNAFAALQNLKVLKLRGNQLKLVPMGAFAKLGNLTSLDLSENKMVILLDYTFQDMRNLKQLEVGDNDLVYMSHKVGFLDSATKMLTNLCLFSSFCSPTIRCTKKHSCLCACFEMIILQPHVSHHRHSLDFWD